MSQTDVDERMYHWYRDLFEITEAISYGPGVSPNEFSAVFGEIKTNINDERVCCPVGDIIPGPRTLPLVEKSEFPWKQTVDAVEIVESVHAYRLSMLLSREGLICGPSSGMNLKGLLNFLQKAKENGELHRYAEPATGEISCVFVCCDLPYQYLDGYFARLGDDDFPPITNQVRNIPSILPQMLTSC